MLFESAHVPPPTKMSMSTLFYQILLYYDGIYTMVLLPFQLFLFIYKYNSLVYTSSTQAGEIILLIVAFFLNWIRLHNGTIANKGKHLIRFSVYFILTIIMIIGFIYLIIWQKYVYWLEFIIHIIALGILGFEFITSIVSLIAYKVSL